jgi:hypothetical protein
VFRVGAACRHDPRRHLTAGPLQSRRSRITADQGLEHSACAGLKKANVAIDYATRLACSEVLPDGEQETRVGFLIINVAWFGHRGLGAGES